MIHEETLPSWKHVWRNGIAPQFSTGELIALENGLTNPDAKLIQRGVTAPNPVQSNWYETIQAADLLAYAAWRGRGLQTVGEVHEVWADVCFECDNRLGEPAACRWFLNWWDDTPFEEARAELLSEIERAIELRTSRFRVMAHRG